MSTSYRIETRTGRHGDPFEATEAEARIFAQRMASKHGEPIRLYRKAGNGPAELVSQHKPREADVTAIAA